MSRAAPAGVRRSLALVAVILFLNYTTAEPLIGWEWPVVSWQMYRAKTNTDPIVQYRRLMAHHQDGTAQSTSDCGTLAMIEHNYRLDALLRSDATRFLTECLAQLRSVQPTVVGVSFERRNWRYAEETLEASRERSPLERFRVSTLPAPRPAELPALDAGTNLLSNGDFSRWDKKLDPPRRWRSRGPSDALGIELENGNKTGLLGRASLRHEKYLEQSVELEPAATGRRVRLSAWTYAVVEGASIELAVRRAEPQRVPVPFDGAWHRSAVEVEIPPRSGKSKATVRLINSGGGDFFVDDVALTELPTAR